MLGSPMGQQREAHEGSGAARGRTLGTIGLVEQAIYGLIALFLVLAALGIFLSTARLVLEFRDLEALNATVVALLDQVLLAFMVAELLHTVRVTLRDRVLSIGPFLVIAVIAAVRRILIVTAQAETVRPGPAFEVFWVELVLLMALVLTLVVALFLWRRAGAGTDVEL
jgi:uncharacterized membrane protein (DUF373 family)